MKAELVQIAREINMVIEAIKKTGHELEQFVDSQELPMAERDYHKAIEIATIEMRSKDIAITEVSLRVKGHCSEELLRREIAEIRYRFLTQRINFLTKQLMGKQSIHKHFDVLET